jgi:hypothetical protein
MLLASATCATDFFFVEMAARVKKFLAADYTGRQSSCVSSRFGIK